MKILNERKKFFCKILKWLFDPPLETIRISCGAMWFSDETLYSFSPSYSKWLHLSNIDVVFCCSWISRICSAKYLSPIKSCCESEIKLLPSYVFISSLAKFCPKAWCTAFNSFL